jgi:N-acetylmuramoyl-L-alanine amidase
MVPEDRRAWHAGASYWAGETDINSRSIGIEIVNPGHEWGYCYFPEKQVKALEDLLTDVASRHSVPPARYLGHSDVAPERKEDPGERFPWIRLAKSGFGLWPNDVGGNISGPLNESAIGDFQQMLRDIGYEIDVNGMVDDWTRTVTIAFQRHFMPEVFGTEREGDPDTIALAIAKELAKLCR